MKITRIIALALIGLLCVGCQQINAKRELVVRNRANDYLRTTLIPALNIPDGLSHPPSHETYPIPYPLPVGPVEHASVVPPGFGTLRA